MDRNYSSVSDLNNYIRSYLEKDSYLGRIFIKGEISNLTKHAAGHWYFTLKDDASRISAVMFNGNNKLVNFDPENGMNVLIEGRVSAYPVSGSYQVYSTKMELDGIGNLYLEFEKLKKRLSSEGLFNTEYKKVIPKYPKVVGVVTALKGAAIDDIVTTMNRRFPYTEIILFPSLVQGKDAASSIVRQIKRADDYGVDTIICGRGGGSYEDLWCFNEEIVARAIFECQTPIISAVGHEIDTTIADFVADLRAPTPTAAAEMAVPTVIDIVNNISQLKIRLNKNVKNMVNSKFIQLRALKDNYILNNPMVMYEIKMQKLDNLIDDSKRNMINLIENKNQKLLLLKSSYIMTNPEKIFEINKNKMEVILANLKNLNPLSILEKGYGVASVNEKVIKTTKDVKIGDTVSIKLKSGSFSADVKEIKDGK